MSANILADLVGALASGKIRIVDLTQTLNPDTPILALPPELGQSWPFRIEEISKYDDRGPAWYWNNFSCGEHTGTHFDAPIHWVTGKDFDNNATDTIVPQRFVAPAVVLDVVAMTRQDDDFLLTVDHVLEWEKTHGRIPPGHWVLMRTDWSTRGHDGKAYLNMREDGAHTPGPDAEVIPFLAKERDVFGFGAETVGTDAGQGFAFDPPFPCHNIMHGHDKFGLAAICNLDKLPPTGAVVIAAPLKIENGSGSPCRVLALVPQG
ncbi:MAG TPA: cyclase family protein [Gammaproteobacteria bacterium]